jgi:hypothetical protein
MVLLKKLTVIQLPNKWSAFNGTWRFITVFTRAHQLVPNLSKINSVHSFPPYFKMFKISLLFMTRSSKQSFPFKFSNQNLVFNPIHYISLTFSLTQIWCMNFRGYTESNQAHRWQWMVTSSSIMNEAVVTCLKVLYPQLPQKDWG